MVLCTDFEIFNFRSYLVSENGDRNTSGAGARLVLVLEELWRVLSPHSRAGLQFEAEHSRAKKRARPTASGVAIGVAVELRSMIDIPIIDAYA